MPADANARSALSVDDRALLRRIGSQMRHIIQGKYDEGQDVDRIDELGILANMVNRVARELQLTRERDQQQRQEIERQFAELQQANYTQQHLLQTIIEVSTPALVIYDGILLLPLVGTLDSDRAAYVLTALLNRIEQVKAKVVILDITGANMVDTHVANLLLGSARAVALLGARVILCGITPETAQVVVNLGIDLSSLTTCGDLRAALIIALRLNGYRVST